MKKVFLAGLLLCFVLSLTTHAQPEKDGWVKLATKTAGYKSDKDEVQLMGKDHRVDKIKLTCTQGTVKLKNIHIKMSDGAEKDFDPKIGVLNSGMSTMNFDLPGKDSKLKEMYLEYDAVGNVLMTKKGKIEVWGKKLKEGKD
ncbi:MAG: hypothetical protein ACK5JD_02010 [Mangrovibacterium sp.]